MTLDLTRVPVTPLRQNCLVISSKNPDYADKVAVLDPGGDVADILKVVGDRKIESILLTHGHFDHAGGAMELAEKSRLIHNDAPPIIGPDERDAFLLGAIERQAQYFGLTGLRNARVDRWTNEGDIINVLGTPLEVLHVPGHTPGHVVFYDKADRYLFSGDTLMRGTVGRSDFDYGDGEMLLDHLHRKIFSLPEDVRVFAGHGMPTSIGAEKTHNPFFRGA